MKYNRDTVLNDLRSFVVEVTFTKVDGTTRVMRCTLDPKFLPESYTQDADKELKFHTENPNVISAWDVQKGGWRSFRIDSVEYLQIIDGGY
jgi:hypothetical protein